jgi:hypothetical protein
MYQAATEVWNAIAASQPISPEWAPLFRANPTEQSTRLSVLTSQLDKRGLSPRAIRGFLLVAPLLSENEAISAYLEEAGRLDLRAALPELTSINEALIHATMEFRLTPSDQEQLRQALRQHKAIVRSGESQPGEPLPFP